MCNPEVWPGSPLPRPFSAVSASYSWGKRFFEEKLSDRELEELVRQARETLETALKNPETSPEHKAEMREALERLEKLLVERKINRIDALDSLNEKLAGSPN